MIYLLLSLSVFLLFALFVAMEINRSLKRGFMKTLISFTGIVFSIIVGIFVGRFFGGLFGRYLVNLMKKVLFKGAYIGGSMNMENIASMLVQAIVSSVLFVVAFLLIRLLFALVVGIICRRKLTNKAIDGRVRFDSTREERKEKWLSIAAGAMCGILVTAAITSPVLGVFGMMQSAVGVMDKTTINVWKAFKLNEEQVKLADSYSRNPPSTFVYSMGGKLIYTASATAMLNGAMVSVPMEMEAVENNVDKVNEIIYLFAKDTKLTPEDIKVLDSVYELTEDSEVFKHILAEYIQKGTSTWLRNEIFMSVPSPKVAESFTSLFTEILRICSGTSADTVRDDVKTLVHIYGDILGCSDYSNILDAITYSDVMSNISNELKQNSRMNNTMIRSELYNVVVISMAAQMALNSGSSINDLGTVSEFMSGVATAVNESIDNDTMTRDQRIEALSEKFGGCCSELGYEFASSAIKLASEAMIDEFLEADEPVTTQQMIEFFGGSLLSDIF